MEEWFFDESLFCYTYKNIQNEQKIIKNNTIVHDFRENEKDL